MPPGTLAQSIGTDRPKSPEESEPPKSPEESEPPKSEPPKSPEEPEPPEPEVVTPPGPAVPDPGAHPNEIPGDGAPPAEPVVPVPPPGTAPEPGTDGTTPAVPPIDQRITDQEITDIVEWGVKNNRTPEDIQADVNSRNEALGGSGEVTIPDLERVTLPQGEVTLTAEEARIYRDLQSDVASMRSDAEYVKDHLKQLETESRKWAALEQNVEGRAVAGIGDLYEDAQTYNAALDDSFADRFGRPGQFSWDTFKYDSYEEALKGWEQTEDYQRYLEARRSAVRDFVAKVNSKVAEDPTGETSWLNRPLQELRRIEAEQDRAIGLLRGVRAETERLAEMERRLAERIPGGGA
jgi:hypothetical protein